jgi:hypothetical protein
MDKKYILDDEFPIPYVVGWAQLESPVIKRLYQNSILSAETKRNFFDVVCVQ